MKILIAAFASALSLACISASASQDMADCLRFASFDTCHHTLNR